MHNTWTQNRHCCRGSSMAQIPASGLIHLLSGCEMDWQSLGQCLSRTASSKSCPTQDYTFFCPKTGQNRYGSPNIGHLERVTSASERLWVDWSLCYDCIFPFSKIPTPFLNKPLERLPPPRRLPFPGTQPGPPQPRNPKSVKNHIISKLGQSSDYKLSEWIKEWINELATRKPLFSQ